MTDVEGAGRRIGWLYGVNMLGASAGALVAPWWLLPAAGIRGAVLFAAGANGLVGVAAFALGLVLVFFTMWLFFSLREALWISAALP